MSSVDDPEKHFLGNLLEDDTGSATSGASVRIGTSTASIIPPLPSVGPVMRPVAEALNGWPEPPPPYSPRMESWELPTNNINTMLSSSPNAQVNGNGWYPFSQDRKEAFDLLGSLGASPPTATPSSPYQQVNYHLHQHTHNVQVQNHYFPTPPSGLESFGPRSSHSQTPSSIPTYDSMTTLSPSWDYTGLAPINTNSNSVLFSDWKKENMSQTSPQPTSISTSSPSLKSVGGADDEEIHLPLSPKEVIEVAKEKKQVSKSYADHLSKSTPKKIIGAEKKHKQELAKMKSSTLMESSRILIKEQPHSAPVVTKMPFSYRDVAARVENSSSLSSSISHSDERKDALSSGSKSSDTKAVQAKSNESVDSKDPNNSFKKSDSNRKSRADNEFQKISKNKVNKSSPPAAPIVYESVHPVDASSRYDVLQNLDNLPVQRNGKKSTNGRPPMIQEIFSRSSSPADDLDDTGDEETQRTRSTSNHGHSNQMKKDQKKRVVQTNQTRRRRGRKMEPSWMDNAMSNVMDYAVLVWSYIVHMFQWTFELIVDVCVKIYDVFLCSFESFCAGTWKGIRKVFLAIVCFFCVVVCYCKNSASIYGWLQDRYVKKKEEETVLEWGCRREIPLPANITEFAERLSRETIRDAYSVFGLRSDCSDDDIKRNYKRLAALVCPDKCGVDGADDAFLLVNKAFNAIGNPETRASYIRENAANCEEHAQVLKAWNQMRTNYEKIKNTLFCDCSVQHYRIATSIPPAQARYCKRCGACHPAKQNDIWVEKRHLGLTTIYFTCTDNVVYDITEWATCESQRSVLKNMRAHTHNVQYRLLSPMTNEYDNTPPYLNSALGYPSSTTDARFLSELQEEYSSLLRQRNLSQISFKTCEPREEDRSRRAANRRQKRWR